MGLAASQGRFLSLTSRKSDLEYQGQQVNQQRTTLANTSSDLFTQMSNLKVPAAPDPTVGTAYTTLYSQTYKVQTGTDPVTGNPIYTNQTDAAGKVYSVSDTTSYSAAEAAYERDNSVYQAEYNRINSKEAEIQQQDKSLETQLKNIDSQHNAVQTEIDAVKKVIDKNIEMTFKTFA